MALSGGSASMRRFPGLNLLAWALLNGNTLVKGVNVSGVAAVSYGARIDFTTAMPNANYMLEVVNTNGTVRPNVSGQTAANATIQTLLVADSTATAVPLGMTYVAVYA